MNETVGRTVRLFLADGNSAGLITAEIMNWSGHVLAGPRSGLNKFLGRPELDRTGVYFLFGRDIEDPDTLKVYIGESDNVRTRLSRHNTDESNAFWERTCVVTSKDQNITKAHARYLESRLIAIARETSRAALANSATPEPRPFLKPIGPTWSSSLNRFA
ncbi:MAG: GIY-YIG nuclease family protein [Gammaproteobacteria bacterium]|nr:GIY-YIG nuclease family protein [Gammaproteobacteria bacterium]